MDSRAADVEAADGTRRHAIALGTAPRLEDARSSRPGLLDRIALSQPNGRLEYRFHARDLHLVMGPPSNARPVRFRVLLDGAAPGSAHGSDVDEQGNGVADSLASCPQAVPILTMRTSRTTAAAA